MAIVKMITQSKPWMLCDLLLIIFTIAITTTAFA